MEGTALAVCEILKYLIIHWKCETTISKGALLEGQLVISIEALSSKHQPNSLHCIASITFAGSICGGLVFKMLLKEIQSILHRFSTKLTCTSEESNYFQDTSRVTPFQIIFEVDEKLRTLKTGCLVIKHFLHKIVIVHHKIRFNFSVNVNGILSTVIFGIENEPTFNLSNGIALVTDNQHYMSKPKFSMTESHCSRIHPVLGHPVALSIPDDVAGMDLLGELLLTPAAALCPSPKVFPSHLNSIASVSIFLYGPLGLPLISNQEQPSNTVFKDTSFFIDWKKYQLYMVPNLDLSLDRDLVLPDVSYDVESNEKTQPQNMDPQGPTLLLFLFVDFHSGFPVQKMEIWGVHTLLTAHLSAILMESHSMVQDSIQATVDEVLEQHHQATKAQQKLQDSLSVAVSSIMSVVTGSTCSSFRRTCLQGLQAVDTQEFRRKLHKIFHDVTQHRFLRPCSCDKEQVTPDRKDSAQSTEDTVENSSAQFLAETGGQAENKRLRKSSLHQGEEEMQSARDLGPPPATVRRLEPAASLAASGGQAHAAHSRAPAPGRASHGSGLEVTRRGIWAAAEERSPQPASLPQDTLWLQEVSNLSEWLSPGPRP